MADLKLKIKILTPSSTADKPPVMVVSEVEASFLKLLEEIRKVHPTVSLTIKESYISKYHYLLEMRKRVKATAVTALKNEGAAVPAVMSTITAGEVPSASAFTEIEGFFNATLTGFAQRQSKPVASLFEPPLAIPYTAFISSSVQVASLLGQPAAGFAEQMGQVPIDSPSTFVFDTPTDNLATDPRRTGRVIFVNEADTIKRADIQEFILNNGPLYGLVPYGNSGLYYYGLEKLKTLTSGKNPVEVIRVIAKFVTQNVNLSNVNITAAQIGSSTFNPIPPPPAATSLGEGTLSYTYPNGDRCSLVTYGRRKVHMHTGREPQFRKHTPERIVLHHTAGWGQDAAGTVEYVGRCLAATAETANQFDPPAPEDRWYEKQDGVQGWWGRSGIHYAVDGNGNVAAGIPEDVESVHANAWQGGDIGIEIGLPGMLSGQPGNLYTSALEKYYTGPVPGTTNFGVTRSPYIQNWEIIDLGFAYGDSNYRYTVEFTDIQITALENLLRSILGRYPNIANKITGRNQWIDVWGLNGKPVPGSTSNKARYLAGSGRNSYGIVTHATGNNPGHDDTVCTPKIVAMLNRLGYNEG